MANKFRSIFDPPSQQVRTEQGFFTWLGSLWRTIGQVEEWHYVDDTGEPAFKNSWTNYGSPEAVVAFYKDPWGIVRIRGEVKNGTAANTIFTLPEGYRPPEKLRFPSVANFAYGDCFVDSAGNVSHKTGSTTRFTLNISFRVDP